MHPTKLSKRHWLLILTLTLLTFVLGTSEFVIVGILTDISSSLHMTNAKAGTLVSAFAITFAIATPLVMSATSHFPKRKWMLFLIGSFIILNALCVISTSYIMLLALRIMTAIVTGVLISLAMIVASETMPIEKRGLAISFVFGGFTLANVVGVPIGTVIAEWYGWNATFMLTTFLGGLAFLASFFVLPNRAQPNTQFDTGSVFFIDQASNFDGFFHSCSRIWRNLYRLYVPCSYLEGNGSTKSFN